jgi:hypothetical protein
MKAMKRVKMNSISEEPPPLNLLSVDGDASTSAQTNTSSA